MFTIERLPNEWHTWNFRANSEEFGAIDFGPSNDNVDLSEADLVRHVQTDTAATLRVVPALGDRPIVARPGASLNILAGGQAKLFVSTPLWFRAEIASSGQPIIDAPFWRPSDSWFGPSTREGELCYAKYTDARTEMEQVEFKVQRAVTTFNIVNKHKDPLLIERLSVPVPMLSLYADSEFRLWTESITVTRGSNDEAAEVVISEGAPVATSPMELVTAPRKALEKRTLIRSLGSLFA